MPFNRTSGDLLADRRYGLGETLVSAGDHEAAADLFAQALERVPRWAPAWVALGVAREKAGQRPAAVAALRRAQALDTSGELGASIHLARLGYGGDLPAALPPAFVRELFDQYADRFDAHLVERLCYRGPALIAAALRRAGVDSFVAALDLGCGTGLMARELAGRAAVIDGIDLAPKMIQQANRTGLYRRLTIDEIGRALDAAEPESYDLVTAADVLVYIGSLDSTLAGAARVLTPCGIAAFTVQDLDDGTDYRLGEDMRFSHGRIYLTNALNQAGLSIVSIDHASTRDDRGTPVPGLVVVARKA